jgi:hypothetical protein
VIPLVTCLTNWPKKVVIQRNIHAFRGGHFLGLPSPLLSEGDLVPQSPQGLCSGRLFPPPLVLLADNFHRLGYWK